MTVKKTLTLTEASELLGMNKSNVAAFLKRRKVKPVETDRGRVWPVKDVEKAKEEYEASGRREADKLRGEVMRKERPPRVRKPNPTRTGKTQRVILLGLAGYEVEDLEYNLARSARTRLLERGLIVKNGNLPDRLTAEGERIAGIVAVEEGLAK